MCFLEGSSCPSEVQNHGGVMATVHWHSAVLAALYASLEGLLPTASTCTRCFLLVLGTNPTRGRGFFFHHLVRVPHTGLLPRPGTKLNERDVRSPPCNLCSARRVRFRLQIPLRWPLNVTAADVVSFVSRSRSSQCGWQLCNSMPKPGMPLPQEAEGSRHIDMTHKIPTCMQAPSKFVCLSRYA